MGARGKTYVLNTGHLNLETLALTHGLDDLAGLGGGIERRATRKNLPVIEDGLREGLAGRRLTEITVEAEGFHDGEVSLDGEERSTRTLLFIEDVSSAAGEHTVDTTHGLLGHLDLDKEDGLEKGGVGKEGGGVQHTTSSGDDLATTTVDGIGVEGNIHDVEADTTHRLLSEGTLAGGPLETGGDGILDFVEVLDGLGLIDNQVGTSHVGTESPDLSGVGNIPPVVVSEDTGTGLHIVTRRNLAVLDILAELVAKRLGIHVDTVVLVGRLGKRGDAGLGLDGLTVLHDRVGDDERNASVVLLEILQANLQVKLTSTGDDVLTRIGSVSQDARVGLGETLETFDKLGEILSVLDLDGPLDDRGYRELHDLEVVGGVDGGEGTGLEQELINTNETDNVTGRHVINGLDLATHHEDGTLDSLDE